MPEVGWLIHEIVPAKSTIGRFCAESTGFTFDGTLRCSECFALNFFLSFFSFFFYENMLLSGYVYKTVASTREFHIDTARANYRGAD